MPKATIVTIGDELLIGQVIDTNSVWLAKQLNQSGISIHQKMTIADVKKDILTTLEESLKASDIVILTGGLGPTKDDLTKESLAEFFNSKLVQDKTVLAHIEGIFKKSGKNPYFHNLKQAEVPDNCAVLFNPFGTAPGMWFEKEGKVIISLPGVPFEMQKIFTDSALPQLKKLFFTQHIYHKTFIITKIGESAAADMISSIEANLPPSLSIAYLPGLGMLRIRLSGQGENQESLQSLVHYEAEKIKVKLGNYCISEEDVSLEEIIFNLFTENHLTLGLAESCTGGFISHKITNVAGSSKYFNGGIISYHNQVKEDVLHVSHATLMTKGAVSAETVEQMAVRALSILKVDYALSISGILGPSGATEEKPVGLIWMAIARKNGKTLSKKLNFRYDRIRNKELAVNHALDWLRDIVVEDISS